MVEFDEPPWSRYLSLCGRLVCPGCRRLMMMHVHYGPGTPATERFQEAAQWEGGAIGEHVSGTHAAVVECPTLAHSAASPMAGYS